MDSKALTDYFISLTDIEKKANDLRIKLEKDRKELEEKEKMLIELSLQLKTIDGNIESKSSQIPKALSEVIAIESENKTLIKQIEMFEKKVSQLKQNNSETDSYHKQRIDDFIEKTFNFVGKYILNSHLRTQMDFQRNKVKSIELKRNELRTKVEKLRQKNMENIIFERNSLIDKINNCNKRLVSLQKENKELDFIETNLKKQLKRIKDNSNECQINLETLLEEEKQMSQTVIETSGTPPSEKPQKRFQFASEFLKSVKESSNGWKCEPSVIDLISDSDSVFSDEKHETIDSFPQIPPICAIFEPKPQISLNVIENERIDEIVIKCEQNIEQNERIWERKRRLKRQKLSNDD